VAQQHTVGQGLLVIEVSRSHTDTPHSVGLLWTSISTSQRPVCETHNTADRHPCPRRYSNP